MSLAELSQPQEHRTDDFQSAVRVRKYGAYSGYGWCRCAFRVYPVPVDLDLAWIWWPLDQDHEPGP